MLNASKLRLVGFEAEGFCVCFQAGGDDEDEDDDFWGSDSESSSSGDEDVKYTGQLTADYFRKKYKFALLSDITMILLLFIDISLS